MPHQKRTSSGLTRADIITVHGDFIAVHRRIHDALAERMSCRYCGSSNELSTTPNLST